MTTLPEGPNHIDLHVGKRIRDRRHELGLSQQGLAEACGEKGLSFQQVQKYERGSNRVSASRLWEIAEALKCSVAFFFEGVPKDAPTDTVDPVLHEARKIYEGDRKRVKHRPSWEDLDLEDPYDAALHGVAVDLARAALGVSDVALAG